MDKHGISGINATRIDNVWKLPCSPCGVGSVDGVDDGCALAGATTPRGGKSGGGSGLASDVVSSLSIKDS